MVEDRQLLLAKEEYAGTKEMLRRVGILTVTDVSKQFTIKAVGNPVVRLDSLMCRDQTTNNNYDILAGQVPQAAPGDTMNVVAYYTNVGTLSGSTFFKATDLDTGAVLFNIAYTLAPNEQIGNSGLLGSMPAHDWRILIELGH